MLFQIFLIAFALFVLQRVFRQYRLRKVTRGWFVFWLLFCLALIGVSLSPQTTDLIARQVGVGRGADLLVYLSLAFLFYLVFKLIAKLDETQRQLTELARAAAIRDAEPSAVEPSPSPAAPAVNSTGRGPSGSLSKPTAGRIRQSAGDPAPPGSLLPPS